MIKSRIASTLFTYKTLFIMVLYLFLPDILAQDSGSGEFTQDASTSFLSILFGGVSDSYAQVLGTNNDAILGLAFRYFNGVVATVGAIVVSYVTTISLMNSASSGTPLGQKWHTLFLPMRITAGGGMLITVANYNFAQKITMWFILTGIYHADNIWRPVADRLSTSGDKAVAGINRGNIEVFIGGKMQFVGADTLIYLACTAAYENSDSKSGIIYPPPTGGSATSRDLYVPDYKSSTPVIKPVNADLAKACGQLSIKIINLSDELKETYLRSLLTTFNILKTDIRLKLTALENQDGPYQIGSFKFNMPSQDVAKSQLSDLVDTARATVANAWQDAVIVAESQYSASAKSSTCQFSPVAKQMKDIGWIAAGFGYYTLISVGNECEKQGQSLSDYNYVKRYIDSAPQMAVLAQGDAIAQYAAGLDIVSSTLESLITNEPKKQGSGAKLGPVNFNPTLNFKLHGESVFFTGINKLVDKLGDLSKILLNVDDMFGYKQAEAGGSPDITDVNSIKKYLTVDPLHNISQNGLKMANLVESLIIDLALLVVTIFGLAAILISYPTGAFAAVGGVLMIALPIMLYLMLYYPVALTLAIYVPLVPFFIYFTGVIGWLVTCVEAMAAAPIVAIGLMHPNGDDVLGQAETGLKLLLNLMLRPVLMIVGLVAGIILVRISLLIFSWGINMVFGAGLASGAESLIPHELSSLGALSALCMAYATTIVIVVHKSFDLINKVPDKVLTWIGATGTSVGEATEFMQKGEQGAKEGGEMPAKGTKSSAQGFKAGSKVGSGAMPGGPPQGGGGGSAGGGGPAGGGGGGTPPIPPPV